MLKLRASKCSALFTGRDGLTEKQEETLDLLRMKISLTDRQAQQRDELIAKRDAPIELPEGAKTLIEEAIDESMYQYKSFLELREMTKGTDMEDESIELYNRIFFTNYNKLMEFDEHHSLTYGCMSGHPDIVDCERRKVIDIKSSWSKKTFPKRPPKKAVYEWQVKMYLYMLTKKTGEEWRDGEVAYMLVNTPEELIPETEDDSLHYMDNLADSLRATIVKIELTDDDIKKIDRRLDAAERYADEYVNFLKSKNK